MTLIKLTRDNLIYQIMTESKQPAGFIIIHDQPELPPKVPFYMGENIIGRSNNKATVVIKELAISQKHARLYVTPDSITIADIGSKNGIKVNNQVNVLERNRDVLIEGNMYVYLADIKCTFERVQPIKTLVKMNQKHTINQKSKQYSQTNLGFKEQDQPQLKNAFKNSKEFEESHQANEFSLSEDFVQNAKIEKKKLQFDIKEKQDHGKSLKIINEDVISLKNEKKNKKLKEQKQQQRENQLKNDKEIKKKKIGHESKDIDKHKESKQIMKQPEKDEQDDKSKNKKAIKDKNKKKGNIEKKSISPPKETSKEKKKKLNTYQDEQKREKSKEKEKEKNRSSFIENKKNDKKKSKDNKQQKQKQKDDESNSKKQKKSGATRSKSTKKSPEKKSTDKSPAKRDSSQVSSLMEEGQKTKVRKNRKRLPSSSVQQQVFDLNPRRTNKAKRILVSGFIPQLTKKYFIIVDDIDDEFNYLVMKEYKRTFKALYAICKGIPIVSYEWIRESEYFEKTLKYENYFFKDKDYIYEASERAKKGRKVFKGYQFCLGSEEYHMSIDEIEVLVYAAGGEIMKKAGKLSSKEKNDPSIVALVRKEDSKTKEKMKNDVEKMKKLGFDKIYNLQFLLDSCERQEIDWDNSQILENG